MEVESRVDASQLFESLDTSRFNRSHWRIIGALYPAKWLDYYELQSLGVVLPLMVTFFGFSNAVLGLLVSTGFAGMLIGSVGMGRVSDLIGRKKAILLSVVLFTIGAVGIGFFTVDIATLFAWRLLQGMGIGALLPICNTIFAEFMPVKWRALVTTVSLFFFTFGSLCVGPIALAIIPIFSWRGVFMVGAALGAVVIALIYILIPESVRQLVKIGKTDEAERIVRKFSNVDPSQMPIKPVPATATEKGKMSDLVKGRFCRISIGLWTGTFCQGMYSLVFPALLTTILTRMGVSLSTSIWYLIYYQIASGQYITPFFSGWLVGEKRIGRRKSLYTSIFLMGLALLGVGFSVLNSNIPLLLCFGAIATFTNGIFDCTHSVFTMELYPTNVRSAAGGMEYGFIRIGAIVGSLSIGLFLSAVHIVFFAEGLLLMFASVVIFFLIRYETRGKSLELISHELSGSLPISKA